MKTYKRNAFAFYVMRTKRKEDIAKALAEFYRRIYNRKDVFFSHNLYDLADKACLTRGDLIEALLVGGITFAHTYDSNIIFRFDDSDVIQPINIEQELQKADLFYCLEEMRDQHWLKTDCDNLALYDWFIEFLNCF